MAVLSLSTQLLQKLGSSLLLNDIETLRLWRNTNKAGGILNNTKYSVAIMTPAGSKLRLHIAV
jgi:hypothetical protein